MVNQTAQTDAEFSEKFIKLLAIYQANVERLVSSHNRVAILFYISLLLNVYQLAVNIYLIS